MTLSHRPYDPLLHPRKFQLQDLLQLLRPQSLEDDNFVEPIHEFRRKLPTGRIHRRSHNLVIQSCIGDGSLGREADAPFC